jgi:hypothetical protein
MNKKLTKTAKQKEQSTSKIKNKPTGKKPTEETIELKTGTPEFTNAFNEVMESMKNRISINF